MIRKRIFICIRLRPNKDKPKEIQEQEFKENLNKARHVAKYAVLNGYHPEATTLYFTQFLNDFDEIERRLGMELGHERLLSCRELWWIENDGDEPLPETSGKWADKKFAEENNIPVVYKDYKEILNWLGENKALID